MTRARIAVFASGAGTNFQALAQAAITGALDAQIVGLVCDRPTAPVIGLAAQRGIAILCLSPELLPSKADYENVVLRFLESRSVDAVALAGYMRIVGPTLLGKYGGRILNLHPSLLPAFPGRGAISAAYKSGARTTGVSVHLVDEGVDTGPLLAQQEVQIDPGWSLEELEEQIHAVEHKLYPRVLQDLIAGGFLERTA